MYLKCDVPGAALWFCVIFSPPVWMQSCQRLSLSHSLSVRPPPPSSPLSPPSHGSPPLSSISSLFSSQWLPLVLATFTLRGFLCSLACQVNSGMSGSFLTPRTGRGVGGRWEHLALDLPDVDLIFFFFTLLIEGYNRSKLSLALLYNRLRL